MSRAASIRNALLLGVIFLLLAGGAAVFWMQTRPEPIRRVVLISIDTCRADTLSCYGYPQETTPNIDRIAAEGVLFENVITTVPHTLPAHCSMLTGQTPPANGVWRNAICLSPSAVTLPEVLADKGFSTAAFVSAYSIASRFGLNQGFTVYDDAFSEEDANAGPEATRLLWPLNGSTSTAKIKPSSSLSIYSIPTRRRASTSLPSRSPRGMRPPRMPAVWPMRIIASG